MTWPDQSRYVGEFKDGMMHGEGEKIYDNGNIHKGQWEDNIANGQGILTTTTAIIEGVWLQGKLEKRAQIKPLKNRG